MWIIPNSDILKYETMFNQLEPLDGKLDGLKCRPVMMKSQLSHETLGRIWDLSDIDDDGCLDKHEFILAMYLCHRCSEGEMLPVSLPPNLIPPGKEAFFSRTPSLAESDPFSPTSLSMVPVSPSVGYHWPLDNLSLVPVVTQPTSPVSVTSFGRLSTSPAFFTYPPWLISTEELHKSNQVFHTIDADADGLVNGLEVRDVLVRSGLPQPVLAQIWNLVDVQGSGMLNCEQFAVAMHLVTDQLANPPGSRLLPSILPPALVPPSFRPLPPDPAIFEESNKLIAEIEAINRERIEVENSYTTLTLESQHRATESSFIQRKLDTLQHTLRSLMTQRSEAERRLSDYSHEKTTLETMLNDLKAHIDEERKEVEELRSSTNNQPDTNKKQSIDQLRSELSSLIREVTTLQDRVSEQQRRLQQVETENLNAQENVEKTSARLESLQSLRDELRQELDHVSNGVCAVDEVKLKALLSKVHGNVSSFGESVQPTPWLNGASGVSSVPAATMHSTRLDGVPNGSELLTSPLAADPFQGIDPFAPDAPVKSTAGAKDDPFASANFFPASDPFAGVDPFGGDPFGAAPAHSSAAVATAFSPIQDSAFDPFAPTMPAATADVIPGFTDADFDSIFNAKPTATQQSNDPFVGDPFSSLEQKALTEEVDTSTTSRRSPPPRPTLQPGAGRLARKSESVSGNRMSRLSSSRSIGSIPSASRSNSVTSPSAGYNTISTPSTRTSLISKVRLKNKPKPQESSSAWAPAGLSEAEQLSLATMESERLARLEERAREQEEADLQLALRLSQLDTQSS